jgi:TldD protein
VIARFQDSLERTIVVSDGVLERVAETRSAGVGIHAFTPEGWSGFASSDACTPAGIRDLVTRSGTLARASAAYGAEPARFVRDLRTGAWNHARSGSDLAASSAAEQARTVVAISHSLPGRREKIPARTTWFAVDEEWRIVRSDGVDVSFATPRGSLRHELTLRDGPSVTTVSANVAAGDPIELLAENRASTLRRRVARGLANVRGSAHAPAIAEGSYRLALDHALAKGLAHEAFGHAAESDVVPMSFLADEHGRLSRGRRFGPSNVSIVDGPVPGDFAYQPVSANGLMRETVHIIRAGILESGLGDLFSATAAGCAVTGACRTPSYRRRPTPRMGNVRIVVSDPAPYAGDAQCLEPEEAAAALRAAGLCDAARPTLLVTGYRGGQAHPKLGDFIFASAATFDLTDGGSPRQPVTLSGRSASALGAVVGALGELQIDAMGVCGKNGVNVSSSGGSHALLVLDAHPDIVVGAPG